ncbi:MAG TPA: DNA methyltransferase [Solirubrobacteraceae bacterium]|nr:DNA methyltransferase [Solirubrobacteraceae bacterium]
MTAQRPGGDRIPATLRELEVPIGALKPYRANPRRGDLEAIKASLEAHGQYRPVVARKGSGEVLAGNHTLAAARELGWESLAATFVEVDDDQAARIVLVDNRTADLAGYDDQALADLLAAIPDLEGTAWRQAELDQLLDRLADQGDAGRDTEPGERPAKPAARPGDLWRLGEHRLVCGDSTDAATVARLFAGGEQAEMVWTDPPYGVDYHAPTARRPPGQYGLNRAGGASFLNDHRDHERLHALLLGALRLAHEHTKAGGAIYVAHSDVAYTHGGSVFRSALLDAGWDLRQVVVWVKNSFVLSRQDYHWQHEPILYGWKPGAGHRWRGGLDRATVVDDDVDPTKLDKRQLVALVRQLQNERGTTVVREDKPHRNDLHPTMKPVALVARQVANSSLRGEIVYEPFGGSGTTLIAAENLGRRCRLVELDPGYCEVIVDRWQRHTGQTAKREPRRKRAA